MKKKKLKIKRKLKTIIGSIILLCIIGYGGYYLYGIKKELKPIENHEDYYLLEDFGYTFKKSSNDYNNNNIDDYTDILNGAKKVAKINPKYVSKYYDGGYPPENEGVCTDLIVSAFKEAGYYLKDLIAKDIRLNFKQKVYGISIIDDNIDYRRVENQDIFFKRYLETLTTDIYDIGQFQKGDILVFDNGAHIAIVSDKRNKNGIPYLIQNSDPLQKEKEEDVLEITDMEVTSHYRFNYNDDFIKLLNEVGEVNE